MGGVHGFLGTKRMFDSLLANFVVKILRFSEAEKFLFLPKGSTNLNELKGTQFYLKLIVVMSAVGENVSSLVFRDLIIW